MGSNTGQVIDLGSLYQRFGGLKDQRKAKGKRYTLAMILVGMFLAQLCGEDKPSGMAEWVSNTAPILIHLLYRMPAKEIVRQAKQSCGQKRQRCVARFTSACKN